jgi:hypothetical protein
MNLNTLQIALIDDDRAGVQGQISEIDHKTQNEAFRQAGAHFGFTTAEAYGREVAYLPEISRVLGYSDASGLRKLVGRYDLESYSLGGYGQNVRQLLLKSFGLHKFSGSATFVTWPVFLVAGMISKAREADAVKRYLLDCERLSRIGLASLEKQEREARQDGFRRAATLARIDGMKNGALQRLALTEIGIDPAILSATDGQPDLFRHALPQKGTP